MQARMSLNLKGFAISLSIVQVIMMVLYGIFVRPEIITDPTFNANVYSFYQDINVMMLMGFGFLMTFIKGYTWSTLSYTFFINSLVVQIYILIHAFWFRVFQGWDGNYFVYIKETTFISASYCVASVLIAFGAVLGRVGPLQLLVMSIVQVIGYSLNQVLVYDVVKMYDAGGSATIHAFGGYFGLAVSFMLGRSLISVKKPHNTYISNIFALIGTFFLWLFWPSFNAGFFAVTAQQKTIIITNTILALTASNLSTFVMTIVLNKKFKMEHILNATLAGGVIIGTSSGLLINSGASLIIGSFGGVLSCLGYYFMSNRLRQKYGIQDTCGVHNLHAMPGTFGGFISSFVIGAYSFDPITNPTQAANLTFYSHIFNGRSFIGQAGIQTAGTFISWGMGILFGLIAGLIIRCFYARTSTPQQFYDDKYNFDEVQMLNQVTVEINNSQAPIDSPMILENVHEIL